MASIVRSLSRKNRGSQRATDILRQIYLEKWRNHFAEVDAFELEEESPFKPAIVSSGLCRESLLLSGATFSPETQNSPEANVGVREHTEPSMDELDLNLKFEEMSLRAETTADLNSKGACSFPPSSSLLLSDSTTNIETPGLHRPILKSISPKTHRLEAMAQTELTPSAASAIDVADSSQEVLDTILSACQQHSYVPLDSAIAEFCGDAEEVSKLGEGTFGEAFQCGSLCFKIVPMEGDMRVNGELQKSAWEILTEIKVTKAMDRLRDGSADSFCSNFIESKGVRICRGRYSDRLIGAWEAWDERHGSENDHPMIFGESQLYVMFVLANGGKDLERYELGSFQEAESILTQVAMALATAELACGFEHRDLHWGNVLIQRTEEDSLSYTVDGRAVTVSTHGVFVSIIDFTLSRLDTDEGNVLFYDLSADPEIFEGPARNIQFDTYRRMLDVTKGQWEERHPKTNCLWLHYLADVLLTKKSKNMSKESKFKLRSFKKCISKYSSTVGAIEGGILEDVFFEMEANNGADLVFVDPKQELL